MKWYYYLVILYIILLPIQISVFNNFNLTENNIIVFNLEAIKKLKVILNWGSSFVAFLVVLVLLKNMTNGGGDLSPKYCIFVIILMIAINVFAKFYL